MDLISRDELKALAAQEAPLCISLFMPTVHVESELSQNPIRLKNLVRKAREELSDQGYRKAEVDEVLGSLQPFLAEGDGFWLDQSDGLAAFVTQTDSWVYRLPISFEELVVTGKRFHLKPLFPLLASNNAFYLLALSQKSVRLYQGTHYAISEVETAEIPRSLVEAVLPDERERRLQYHTGNEVAGRRDAIYHGHGAAGEDDKARPHEDVRRFFKEIDRGLRETLEGETAPLVLAGVEYYLPIYREVNTYEYLVEDAIVAGNPEPMSPKALHDRAWKLLEPRFLEMQRASVARYEANRRRGDGLASFDLREILPAARFGRVDTLLVPIGEHQWGRYDCDTNAVELHDDRSPGDDDLLDLAAVHAYMNGGTVHALRRENMPNGEAAGAIFRYVADLEAETA